MTAAATPRHNPSWHVALEDLDDVAQSVAAAPDESRDGLVEQLAVDAIALVNAVYQRWGLVGVTWTVETVEQLAALPTGSVVVDRAEIAWQKDIQQWMSASNTHGSGPLVPPVRVVSLPHLIAIDPSRDVA